MTRIATALAATFFLSVGASQAQAVVAFTFTGKVTSVTSALSSGFTVNQAISGYISYDDKAGAGSSSSTDAYYYNSFTGYIKFGNKFYTYTPTTVMFVSNNNSYNQDQASFYSSTSGGSSVGGLAPGYLTVDLYDSSRAAVSSTAPATVAQLKSFPSKYVALYFGGNFDNSVQGTISSITALPEPASWVGMTMGFGLLGIAMRRRGQATLPFA